MGTSTEMPKGREHAYVFTGHPQIMLLGIMQDSFSDILIIVWRNGGTYDTTLSQLKTWSWALTLRLQQKKERQTLLHYDRVTVR